MNFGTVAILGPGLIGGSLALALAEGNLADKIVIYARRDAAFPEIKAKLPQAECTTDVKLAVRDADIVILCVPIEKMAPLVQEFRDALKPTALVTDVGSVKGSVEKEISPLLKGRALWIGSHPMAGSEQAGFATARAALFVNAAIILTPADKTPKEAVGRAEEFWRALGGRLTITSPEKHDQTVAGISHLPHLVAAALVNYASKIKAFDVAGSGFRDTTRIASGSPELWTEILFANRDAVAQSLRVFIDHLEDVLTLITLQNPQSPGDKDVLRMFLQTAKDERARLPARSSPKS